MSSEADQLPGKPSSASKPSSANKPSSASKPWPGDRPPLAAVVVVLGDALRALAATGHSEDASRLAGRAYVALRREHPDQARRINAQMHVLTRMPNTTKEHEMSTTDPELDVRTEIPARRHELIFETYGKLAPATAFILVNDHDPKPLYYQFDAEHNGEFTWDYLEEGPDVWRVRIGRTAA